MSMNIDTSVDAGGDVSAMRVTLLRGIRAEWTKLITTRVTLFTMVITFAMMSVGSILIEIASPFNVEGASVNLATHATLHASFFTPIAVGVLGILTITIEYSSGTIQTSVLAVPKRWPIIFAKAIAVAAVTFVVIAASSLAAFEVVRVLMAGRGLELSATDPEALGIVFGGAGAMSAFALIAFALGALIRSTAGAVTVWLLVLYVAPIITAMAGGAIGDAIFPYLPTALAAGAGQDSTYAGTLSSAPSLAILFAYGVVGSAVAAVLLKRRDA